MCDYSTEAERQRPAEAGESLVTHVFHFSALSVACIAPNDLETAVCLLEGTKVLLTNVSMGVRRHFGVTSSFEAITATRKQPTHYDATHDYDYHTDCIITRDVDGRLTLIQLRDLGEGVGVEIREVPASANPDYMHLDENMFRVVETPDTSPDILAATQKARESIFA